MSCSIGPNGFHDGEAPDYNYDDDDAQSDLCDNPAYLVVGADDDLVDNLPSWVESALDELDELLAQAELIGLCAEDYVDVPSRGDNGALRDYLDNLGFSVNASYIERGPASSLDGVVFVQKKKIPAIKRRIEARLQQAKRAVIKAARLYLKPPRITAEGLDEEISRLVGVAQLNEPAYRAKLNQLDDLEAGLKIQKEINADHVAQVRQWKLAAGSAKAELAGEPDRNLEWIAKARSLSNQYNTWVWSVAAEFNIHINGPLLKCADGRTLAVANLFGVSLRESFPHIYAGIEKQAPAVQWLYFQSSFRIGVSSMGSLTWERALRQFDQRLSWGHVWWILLGQGSGRRPGSFSLQGAAITPVQEAQDLTFNPIKLLGLRPEQLARWYELIKEHWGEGITLRRSIWE